jgi:O-methyltransferase
MNDHHTPPEALPQSKEERSAREPEQWTHRTMDSDRSRPAGLQFRPSAAFFELADFVKGNKRTLLGYDRLYVFWQAAGNLVNVPGGAAEIGAYRGGSAYFIASALRSMTGDEVPMQVFDTFEGHPAEAITEHDPFQRAGQFQGTDYDRVRTLLSPFTRLQIHKGDVLRALAGLAESVYRLVHIDTDLYQPTIGCLDYFGARMSPGGVIVLDDYGSRKCPGVPKALSEYLDRNDQFQVWDMRTEQVMLIKR